MTLEEVYPILQLFIDKTGKLEDSGFCKKISQEFSLDINIENDMLQINSIRPNQENIDAFVLTFRFFIQEKDGISIRGLQRFFDSDLVTNEEKAKYFDIRNRINSFLSESSNLTIYDENITNDILMHTFIYGGLAHATKDKKEKLDLWMDREDAREFLWHKFSIIVLMVLQAVQSIRDMLLIIVGRQRGVG